MHDHIFDDRAGIQLGTVQSINDSGQAQTATVQTTAGGVYADVEVIQSYGAAGVPPADGCLALLLAIGGDPANLRAILFHPSFRFGGQASGEFTLYGPGGARIAFRAGGGVEVKSATQVTITAPNVSIDATGTLSVTAAAMLIIGGGGTALQIQGDLEVQGVITTTGSIHAGGGYH